MKWLIYLLFIFMYLFVTLFVLGPVLLADGSFLERMITLSIALFLYFMLTYILLKWRKVRKGNS